MHQGMPPQQHKHPHHQPFRYPWPYLGHVISFYDHLFPTFLRLMQQRTRSPSLDSRPCHLFIPCRALRLTRYPQHSSLLWCPRACSQSCWHLAFPLALQTQLQTLWWVHATKSLEWKGPPVGRILAHEYYILSPSAVILQKMHTAYSDIASI